MDTLYTVLIGVIVLAVLIVIHEGGHFLAAKAFGVRVIEFMVGLPGPRLGVTIGETRFGVTAVPLGGYARICGMEPGPEKPHLKEALFALASRKTANMEDIALDCGITDDEAYDCLEELTEWGSATGPTRRDKYNTYRLAPALAAFCAERVLASAAPADALATPSAPVPADEPAPGAATLVPTAAPAPAAPDAALTPAAAPAPADALTPDELYAHEFARQYRSLSFWKRALILIAGPAANILAALLIFIVLFSIVGFDTSPADGTVRHVTVDVGKAIVACFSYIWMVIQAVAQLFNPTTVADVISESTSVVGIAVVSKQAFDMGWFYFFELCALVSISLGVMNMVPIPPLDGGKFLVEILERILHRSLPEKASSIISIVGILLFLLLFVVLMWQDLQRFVFGV